MNQTWKNGKRLSFGPDLGGSWTPSIKRGHKVFKGKKKKKYKVKKKKKNEPQNFFLQILSLLVFKHVPSYHSMHFTRKLMNQTWGNGKKPNFRPDFGPNLVSKIFFVCFTSTRC